MANAKETKKTKKTTDADEPTKEPKAPKSDKGEPGNTVKFAQFIETRKLDRRRILAVSRRIERLRPEDRIIKLNKRRARKAASDGADNAAKETRKPRSGRPVTPRAFDAALRGSELGGATKTRILRAVNHLLDLKKEEKVDLKALF
jgi:hypothetical protein